jgi:peptide chain release factor 1
VEILDKLEAIKKRWEDLSNQMNDPAAMSDMKRFVQLNKDYKELEPIVKAYEEYVKLLADIKSAKDVLSNEKDPDYKEMAKDELDELEPIHYRT